MSYTVDENHNQFISDQVASGRFSTPEDVVNTAIMMLRDQELKRQALKVHIDAAIKRGGSHTSEEVKAHIQSAVDDLNLPNA